MAHPVESKMTGPAAPMAIEHSVPLYLASDEALIHLLNRYPADLVEVNCDPFEARRSGSPVNGLDAASILDAIRTGEIWVNLRGIERGAPGLWAEMRHTLGVLAPHIGAGKAGRMTGQLILSSSTVRSPYHFDAGGVVLFHLRGVKRVWVYPTSETYLPQQAVEQAVVNATDGLLNVRGHDSAAWRFDIVPGEALAWPLFAPNRAEDQEGLCVSLMLGYETTENRITTAAHRANAVFRRWGWPILAMDRTPMAMRAALSAMAWAFDRLGLMESRNAVQEPAPAALETNSAADFSQPAAA